MLQERINSIIFFLTDVAMRSVIAVVVGVDRKGGEGGGEEGEKGKRSSGDHDDGR